MARIWTRLAVCAGLTVPIWVPRFQALPAHAAPGDQPPADQPPPLAGRTQLPAGASVLLLGHAVKNAKGTVVGQITNVIVDQAGQPLAAVLDYGGFLGVGHRKIAVAWQVLQFAGDGTADITLTLTIDQLKAFPEYKADAAVTVATPPAEAEQGDGK